MAASHMGGPRVTTVRAGRDVATKPRSEVKAQSQTLEEVRQSLLGSEGAGPADPSSGTPGLLTLLPVCGACHGSTKDWGRDLSPTRALGPAEQQSQGHPCPMHGHHSPHARPAVSLCFL